MKENRSQYQGIDTVIVRVSDILNAKQWYQDKLGLTMVWDDSCPRLIFLDTGSPTSLTLWQTDEKIEHIRGTASYPIFRTLHAETTIKELQDNGVLVGEVIVDGPVQYFLFYNPDGNVLEACQVHE